MKLELERAGDLFPPIEPQTLSIKSIAFLAVMPLTQRTQIRQLIRPKKTQGDEVVKLYNGLPLGCGDIKKHRMRAYSQDLRERVIQAVESRDGSQVEIAERCGVSVTCVERLWQRWRTTGSCAALPHAGGRPRQLQAWEAESRAAVAADGDIPLAALCEQVVQAGGPTVSRKTMCIELQRLALPRKKSRSLPLSATPPA